MSQCSREVALQEAYGKLPRLPGDTRSLPAQRLYDERKPLEPSYSPSSVSQAGTTYLHEDSEDMEKLLHAPPG